MQRMVLLLLVGLVFLAGCTTKETVTGGATDAEQPEPPIGTGTPTGTGTVEPAAPERSTLSQGNEYGCLAPFTLERIRTICGIQDLEESIVYTDLCHFERKDSDFGTGKPGHSIEVSGIIWPLLTPLSSSIEERGKMWADRHFETIQGGVEIATINEVEGVGEQAWVIRYDNPNAYEEVADRFGWELLARQGEFGYHLKVGYTTFGDRDEPAIGCNEEEGKELLRQVIQACENGETGYCAEIVRG